MVIKPDPEEEHAPVRINKNISTLREIKKLENTKHKEKILKAARETKTNYLPMNSS